LDFFLLLQLGPLRTLKSITHRVDPNTTDIKSFSYNVENATSFIDFFLRLTDSNLETYENLPDYTDIDPKDYLDIVIEVNTVYIFLLFGAFRSLQFVLCILTNKAPTGEILALLLELFPGWSFYYLVTRSVSA